MTKAEWKERARRLRISRARLRFVTVVNEHQVYVPTVEETIAYLRVERETVAQGRNEEGHARSWTSF